LSIGIGLLKCLIENDIPFTTLLEKGIDEKFFESEKEKLAYNFIKDFRERYGKYPELTTLEQECKISILQRLPKEPLEYWIEKVLERYKANALIKLVSNLEKNIPQGEIDKSLEYLDKIYLELKNVESKFKIHDLYEVEELALQEQCEIQLSDKDIPGIPTGLPALDKLTGGFRGGDLIFIVGETGSTKSYVSLYFGLQAYLNDRNVMMISPEMPEKQIGRRALALGGKISDRLLKQGQVYYYGVQKLKKIIKEQKNRENWFKVLPAGMFTDIHSVLSAVSEYKPDILIVDGVYLIKDTRLRTNARWEKDENIVFLLKELAMREDIPVVATTQYSRKGKNKREGARGTQSVEQTASLFLSLEFEYEEDKEMAKPITTRLLKIKKGRDGERMTLRLRINFEQTSIEEEDVISAPSFILDDNEDINDDKLEEEI